MILSILIGCTLALLEISSKYPKKRLKDLLCLSLLFYVFVHASSATATYYLLPFLWKSSYAQADVIRIIASGLGYPVILRSKFFAYNRDGKTIAIGGEHFYDLLLNATTLGIDNNIKDRAEDDTLYLKKRFPDIEYYHKAFDYLISKSKLNIDKSKQGEYDIKKLLNAKNEITINPKINVAACSLLYFTGNREKAVKIITIAS